MASNRSAADHIDISTCHLGPSGSLAPRIPPGSAPATCSAIAVAGFGGMRQDIRIMLPGIRRNFHAAMFLCTCYTCLSSTIYCHGVRQFEVVSVLKGCGHPLKIPPNNLYSKISKYVCAFFLQVPESCYKRACNAFHAHYELYIIRTMIPSPSPKHSCQQLAGKPLSSFSCLS